MKVLFTTEVIGDFAEGGPALRIENSIKALNKVSELHIICRISKKLLGGAEKEKYFRQYAYNFKYTPLHVNPSFNRFLYKLGRIYRAIILMYQAHFILNYAKRNDINIIWFGFGNISFPLIKLIKKKRPNLKIVCDTDSVWSRFVLRGLPFEDDPIRRKNIERNGKKKEIEERAWVNLCDVTTAVSEVDAEYYREISKDPERIKIFSNVIDFDFYQNHPLPPADFKKPCIYLAGSFGLLWPMDRAARWVIEEVFPLLQKAIHEIHFYIIGKGSKETFSDINNKNITIVGRVTSVLPFLCNADVSIVPLHYESGTRFKILEAGAAGVPIVSTTIGAEGIPVTHGKDIMIADEPEHFAKHILGLVEDKLYAKKIASNCKKLIQENYSIESLAKEGKEIINYLML